jgi:hypothetical protein
VPPLVPPEWICPTQVSPRITKHVYVRGVIESIMGTDKLDRQTHDSSSREGRRRSWYPQYTKGEHPRHNFIKTHTDSASFCSACGKIQTAIS